MARDFDYEKFVRVIGDKFEKNVKEQLPTLTPADLQRIITAHDKSLAQALASAASGVAGLV
jgi:hypothetical protein